MNQLLDNVWEYIEFCLDAAVLFMDKILSPLETAGSWLVILVLAMLTVGVTKVLGRYYVTKRYRRLEKEFRHWKDVREEAMKLPDKEKGKALAKNIDQAHMNKAYYDYFFEGLLKSFITTVLPILLMAAYVIRIYSPANLLDRFGKEWIFSIVFSTSSELNISAALWFLICLIFSFICFAILKILLKKLLPRKKPGPAAIAIIFLILLFCPSDLFATQLHKGSEGIIVHQMGHLFFLFSMVALMFTINGKNLGKTKGWRLIKYSAFLFILWNIDTFTAHLFDNMMYLSYFERLSSWKVNIVSLSNSSSLAIFYYLLKLDHLLCVPAMFLLYSGIKQLLETQKQEEH